MVSCYFTELLIPRSRCQSPLPLPGCQPEVWGGKQSGTPGRSEYDLDQKYAWLFCELLSLENCGPVCHVKHRQTFLEHRLWLQRNKVSSPCIKARLGT